MAAKRETDFARMVHLCREAECYRKVKTDASERLNRRVTIRTITPLITVASVD